MLSVRSSNRLEVPVATHFTSVSSNDGSSNWVVFVAEDHLQFLVSRANQKMMENFKRIRIFEKAFQRCFYGTGLNPPGGILSVLNIFPSQIQTCIF